jgi:tRNA pseudouridine55 synthase
VIDGILAIDKPAGWTSHDVVARMRRVTGQRQVGHAGTLDPLATGVLVVVLGRATRLSRYLMDAPKVYCAEVVLGAATVTDDVEAPLQTQADVSSLRRADVEAALPCFLGEIDQLPPSYAAVKREGRKLYELARQGADVPTFPRRVTIHDIDLLRWEPPRLRLRVRCAAGTYIRALARDIGTALAVGGYLHALRRVASGTFTVSDASTLSQLPDADSVRRRVEPLDRAVLGLPAIVLSEASLQAVRHGRPVMVVEGNSGTVRLYGAAGAMAALGEQSGTTVRPVKVFEGGGRARHE